MCGLKIAICEFFVLSQLKENGLCMRMRIHVCAGWDAFYLNTHFRCNDKITIYKLRI